METNRSGERLRSLVKMALEMPSQPDTLIRERVAMYLTADSEKLTKRKETWTAHIISRAIREIRREGVIDEAMMKQEDFLMLRFTTNNIETEDI